LADEEPKIDLVSLFMGLLTTTTMAEIARALNTSRPPEVKVVLQTPPPPPTPSPQQSPPPIQPTNTPPPIVATFTDEIGPVERKVLELFENYGITKEDIPYLKKFDYLKGGEGDLSDILFADKRTQRVFLEEYRKWRRGQEVFLLRQG
jgi:hypothetical protein